MIRDRDDDDVLKDLACAEHLIFAENRDALGD